MAADVARWVLALMGAVLAVMCGGSLVYAKGWDQTSRFIVLAGYAVITIGGQLDSFGKPPTWRTWGLVIITAWAIVATLAFLVRNVRVTRGGPGDGRSRRNQRRILWPGPPAGGAGDAGHGTGPESGSPAA